MKRLLFSSLFVTSLVAACVATRPISEGQECPCVPGYKCDELAQVCLPMGAAGTGGPVDDGQDHTPPVEPGCGASCGTPAGAVQPLTTTDAVYTAMQGRWQFCGGTWKRGGDSAPDDAIGVEFGVASRARTSSGSTVGGKMYYLVAGPNGPQRGAGFAYQLTYDVSGEGESAFQINMHPSPNSGFGGSMRYSPCPTELELNIFDAPSTLVRFSPGDGVKP